MRANTATALKRLQSEMDGEVSTKVSEAKAKLNRATPEPFELALRAIRDGEIRSMIAAQAHGDSLEMAGIVREIFEKEDIESLDALLSAPAIWQPLALLNAPLSLDDLRTARSEFAHKELGPAVVDLVAASEAVTEPISITLHEISPAVTAQTAG
ncbi:hypothetical protein N9F34_03875 [Alphaproteobacteria bacterium]|nr:hypothetical protein [Alphaproteobacteria bacterium]